MQLTESDLKQFKSLYQKHFGIVLDNKQVQQKLALLVLQLEITYRPITKGQAEKYGNGNRNEKLTSEK